MIVGLLQPDEGFAEVHGFRTSDAPDEVKSRIGLVSAEDGLYPWLTVREMLLFFADLYGVPPQLARERIDPLVELLQLGSFFHRRCATLSSGQRQRVTLARALIHDPPVMLMDEPTRGLDVVGSQVVFEYIAVLARAGKGDHRQHPSSGRSAAALRSVRASPPGASAPRRDFGRIAQGDGARLVGGDVHRFPQGPGRRSAPDGSGTATRCLAKLTRTPAAPGAHAVWRRTFGRLVRLCLKELRDILRDRRTVVTLVLMPLLVYPLLSILFQKLLVSSQSATGQIVCIVGLESEQAAGTFQEYVVLGDQVLLQRRQASEQRKADAAPAAKTEGGSPPESVLIRWVTGPDLQQRVANGDIDVAVTLREMGRADGAKKRRRNVRVQFLFRETSVLSQKGLEYLEDRLQAFNEGYLLERLSMVGVPARLPVEVESRPIRDARPPSR